MRIKTITCHECYNLGASLQAFALQHYLEGQGHDVQIIHYKPDYLSNHYKLGIVTNPKFDKPIVKWLYLAAKFPSRLMALKRKKVFDAFTAEYLHLTRRYNSYKELKSDAPDADVYIAGSDQIWNTLFKNGRDAAFYLDFGHSSIKRISYAASFSTPDIVPEYRDFVSSLLKNFYAISIREKISLPLLKSLGIEDGIAVCDPVFLLSKEEWIDFAKDCQIDIETGYILVYLTDYSDVIKHVALHLKKKTGWKIYVVGEIKVKWADKIFVNAGPLEFIKLVNQSNYVVSNSFHATAFSLIFEKNFCVVNRKESINERMKSLLCDFGLDRKLINTSIDIALDEINYNNINIEKNQFIKESKQWLANVLDNWNRAPLE